MRSAATKGTTEFGVLARRWSAMCQCLCRRHVEVSQGPGPGLSLAKHRLAVGHDGSTSFNDAFPGPKRIDRPRRGLNDISVLSEFCCGRILSRGKAVI